MGRNLGVAPHETTHVSSGIDAFLLTDILEAIVKRLQEAGGPTTLTMGTVADGQALKRSGSSIVGAAIPSTPISPTNGGTGISNPTAHTLPVAEGSSNFTFLGPLTNGQLLVGSTSADPVAAALTQGAGITITNGAGSITVALTTPVSSTNGGTGVSNPTAHSLLVAEGASAMTALGSATNGQIPIGSTGADPVLATLTAGTNVTVTNGPGSVTIAAGSVTGTPPTITIKTSSFTANVSNTLWACNASSAGITVTLQAANAGACIMWFQKTDTTTNGVAIVRAGTDTVQFGGNSLTQLNLNVVSATLCLVSDGTSKWYVI